MPDPLGVVQTTNERHVLKMAHDTLQIRERACGYMLVGGQAEGDPS